MTLAAGLLALIAALPTPAMEQRPLVLRHLTTADGLPQATVMTTLRDSQGFVWFGTEDGLVRYDGAKDGQKLVRYARATDGSNSLAANWIWQVVEDANHDLWIAMDNGGGVARWRRGTDRFDLFQHAGGNADSIASNNVRALLIDAKGRIWIGTTDAGVDILDPRTGHVQHLRHDPKEDASLSSDKVYTLLQDRGGDVWIGTDGGLDRWHSASGRISRVGGAERDPLLRAQVYQLLENADDTFWVGTYDKGMALIDHDGKVLRREQHDGRRPGSLASNEVHALLRDKSGNLWVGTADGLDLLEPDSNDFLHYQYDAGDIATLRNSNIMSLYQDATGLVWIGTRGGVSRWSPRSWEMGGARPQWLRGDQFVMGFADAPGREVWIASMAGLYRYDTTSGNATSIDRILGRANALGDSSVMSLKEGSDGSLWIGTKRAGLKRLRSDHSLQSFPVARGKPRSLSAPGITSLAESRTGRIWVGTYSGGVNIVDPASGEIRQLPFDGADAVSGADVLAILEDTQGNFWLGTDEGIALVSAEGRLLRRFRNNPADPGSLPSDVVFSLALDSHGRVWAGTYGGVARALDAQTEPAKQQLKAVTLGRGQESAVAWGVAGDPRGGIWVSGNTGLVYFDPDKRIARAYHREDGLQGEEFNNGAVARLSDGRLGFGGPGGFNIFNPQKLSGLREPPSLQLIGAAIAGVPVAGATPAWMRQGLSLGYRDNIASLDFAVLDFAAPNARMQYRIAGLSDQWIDLGSQRSITLTSLPAGDHILEVRAASADSPWSAPLRFTLHRDQKPWLTPWAFALYALLIGLAIALRVRHEKRKFRDMERARDHLETQVKERTVELVESNRQLAEAARAKSDFLDRMSHELRTPMNGVVGMTELLTRTSLSATQTHLTKTIRASAQILLQIVNDLLDLSKIRAGKIALESLPVDIGQVLEECTSLFAGAAEAKGLELIVCPPREARRALRGDPLRVRQVLMNLVGNAVKFTAQGEIVVRADVDQRGEDQATVRLSVTDTGIGMEEAVLAKIFEPFTQADEKTTRQFGGTGLGLAICRELAEVMGGSITVESRAQVGSTFTVHLPMQLGPELPAEPQLDKVVARLATRRPSLAESLQRHCALLGLELAWDPQANEREPQPGEVLFIDATSCEALLARCLTRPELCRGSLVVIATPAEVERLSLTLLLPERAVVLKPVHHVAVREALATVMGKPELIQSPAPRQEQQRKLRGHIVLVEDDPVNAAVAEGYLAELGCTSAWVTSAKAAIAREQTKHLDLVFMDLNMSDMDGFTATTRIREREAAGTRIPILALTAHDARSYRERVLKAGMDDILSKPYSLDDCRAMLMRWIGGNAVAKDGVDAAPQADPTVEVAANDDTAALACIDAGAVQSLGRLGAGGPQALYNRLASLFESSSQPVMAQLDAAVKGRDFAQAAGLCHRLKSSSANVGAMAFAAGLRELEQHCREANASSATELHGRLTNAYGPLLAELRTRRIAESA